MSGIMTCGHSEIVLCSEVDSAGVFEVLFLGSMCAKYYLSLHEGDLIQFRGYSTICPQKLQLTLTTSPLIYYGPDASGSALHVPSTHHVLYPSWVSSLSDRAIAVCTYRAILESLANDKGGTMSARR